MDDLATPDLKTACAILRALAQLMDEQTPAGGNDAYIREVLQVADRVATSVGVHGPNDEVMVREHYTSLVGQLGLR